LETGGCRGFKSFWLFWKALIAHCTQRDGGGALSETVATVSLSTVPRQSTVPAVSGEADVLGRAGGVECPDLAVRKDQMTLRK